jgi:hypothetical protein
VQLNSRIDEPTLKPAGLPVFTPNEKMRKDEKMNQQRHLQHAITAILVLLFLAGCGAGATATPLPTATATPTPAPTPTPTISPLEARAGEWRGATEFGSFTFVVAPGGTEITSIELAYYIGITSGTSSITPEDGGIPIAEDGSFGVSLPDGQLTFRGKFSQDGTSATGLWEMAIPLHGTSSEEWTIERR